MAWERFYADGWRQDQGRMISGIPSDPALPDAPLPSPAAVLVGLTLELAGEQDATLRRQAEAALRLSYRIAEEQPFGHALSVWILWSWAAKKPLAANP